MPTPASQTLQSLRRLVELLISGRMPDDPLYLSNRTADEVIKKRLLIFAALGALVVAAVLAFKTFGPTPPLPKDLTAAEVASEQLKDLNTTIHSPPARDLAVLDVHVDHTTRQLTGSVRNTTNRKITGDIFFTVTAINGMQ